MVVIRVRSDECLRISRFVHDDMVPISPGSFRKLVLDGSARLRSSAKARYSNTTSRDLRIRRAPIDYLPGEPGRAAALPSRLAAMAKPETRVEGLLADICIRYGFCLPPDEIDALVAAPPPDVDSFVDAVLVAEGRDPALCDKETREYLSEAVRAWLFDEGQGKGTKSGLP